MQNYIIQNINRKNLYHLLCFRLVAIIGQISAILFSYYFLKISLPFGIMLSVIALTAFINLISFYRYDSKKNISNFNLFLELFIDVIALSAQLYLSGGASNPFISIFLLQVFIGTILLVPIYSWIIGLITIFCYIILSFFYYNLYEIYNNDFAKLHLFGMISSHIIATILLIFFGTNIMKNLRERNKQIIKLKQQAFEKDQLVKMGLFATSAAHELGSPLSTIAILISDLKNGFKNLKSNSEFLKDLDIIEKQIERCKKIISEILSLHGKKRLEKASPKLLKNAFNELIQEWVNLRCSSNIKEILKYKFIGISDKKIILSDDLKLAFFNIFDNAIEASLISISIEIKIIKNDLFIEVVDCGSGFDKKILDNLGNPNISSKIGHSGMGLYLAINCFKAIDGEVEIVNNKNSGAKVLIKIPLNNL